MSCAGQLDPADRGQGTPTVGEIAVMAEILIEAVAALRQDARQALDPDLLGYWPDEDPEADDVNSA